MEQKIEHFNINDLSLWTENPRDPIWEDISDLEVIQRAIDTNPSKWHLDKLLEKMGNFYHYNKLPIVVKKNGKNIVYDGNRRVALLKYVNNPDRSLSIEWKLFPSPEIMSSFRDTAVLPCAVCDEDTALQIIYLDNTSNNTWDPLAQSYFEHYHLKKEKDLFLQFDEITHLISSHDELNQRFIKDEVLTEQNLKSLWIYIKDGKIISWYKDNELEILLWKLLELIKSGTINTRNNEEKGTIRVKAGELGKVVEEKWGVEVKPIAKAEKNETPKWKDSKNDWKEIIMAQKRTPVKNPYKNDVLFGKILLLKEGAVNALYSGICLIYDRFKNDKNFFKIIPILGMSLRLLLDVWGREYFSKDEEKIKKDQLRRDFINQAKEDFKKQKKNKTVNYLALNQGRIEQRDTFEGPLGKRAHWQLPTTKQDLLQVSFIVADILDFYFSKE